MCEFHESFQNILSQLLQYCHQRLLPSEEDGNGEDGQEADDVMKILCELVVHKCPPASTAADSVASKLYIMDFSAKLRR